MSLLLWVTLGVCLGWAGVWWVLGRQVQKQGALEKKLDHLESTD